MNFFGLEKTLELFRTNTFLTRGTNRSSEVRSTFFHHTYYILHTYPEWMALHYVCRLRLFRQSVRQPLQLICRCRGEIKKRGGKRKEKSTKPTNQLLTSSFFSSAKNIVARPRNENELQLVSRREEEGDMTETRAMASSLQVQHMCRKTEQSKHFFDSHIKRKTPGIDRCTL